MTGAGNGGVNANTYVPAAYDDSAITVTATNEGDGWSILSNYGDVVAIAAPGENILTTTNDGGYTENSGSSFAAPHVAGAIALWIQKNQINGVSCTNYTCFTDALADIEVSAEPIPDDGNHTEDLLDVEFLIHGP